MRAKGNNGAGMQLLHSRASSSEVEAPPSVGVAERLLSLLRRVRGERESGAKQLHLLEALSLGGKRQLLLVSCAGERFLVGGGLDSVQTIVRAGADPSLNEAAKKLDGSCL